MEQISPIPSMMPKPQVHSFAEDVAAQLGYAPNADLDPFLEKMGGRLAYRPLFSDSESADSIHVEPDGRFTIFISGLTSAERDRFTIAHELGHYFLHFPIVRQKHPGRMMVATRWVDDTDATQRRAEWEANWFAAAFLMPAGPFREAAGRCDGHVPSLASEFGVSIHAAQIRLRSV